MLGFGLDTGVLAARRQDRVASGAIVLDFTTGVLPSVVTLTRASAATVVNATGQQVSVAADVPRFDHDRQTGAPLGLLVETGVSNFVIHADLRTHPHGNNTNIQAMPAVTGPDGKTGSVYRLPQGAQSSTFLKLGQFSGSDAKVISLWVKAMGADTDFQFYADGSAGISPVKTATGDWVRAFHSAARSGQWGLNNGSDTYGSDILIALPQIEFGLTPSSYIPTSGNGVDRAPDLVRVDGINGMFDVTLRYGSGVEEIRTAQNISDGWWPSLSAPHLARIILRPSA